MSARGEEKENNAHEEPSNQYRIRKATPKDTPNTRKISSLQRK